MTPYPRDEITAVVLAGGKSRRMGGEDKGLVEVAGRPMVAHTIDALRPQTAEVVVNANRNAGAYRTITGCRVIADTVGDFAGPLAGMASALESSTTRLLLTAPCDSPLVTGELGPRLHAALIRDDAEIAVAHDGERMQPVFALLTRGLLPDLLAFLAAGERKIDTWYATRHAVIADFSDILDTFLNVNTPQERDRLEQRLARRGMQCE
ncbi:MAG: molybdenum cofactor guanylyltransferase [Thiotrichales bacterium]|nr:molybdenum cofactor guanylyltransferase [Thiotrichales bacterium]